MARFVLIVALFASVSVAHAAGPYDPALTWRTIRSPRFLVHYPDGARNLAVRISRSAEAELDGVAALFGYVADHPIEIVLTDAFDRANGSARVVPRDIIEMRLTAPTELTGLSGYDDWHQILLVHELAHICVIDQVHGLLRPISTLLGSYVRLNSFTPQFLSEGVAVYAETLLTATGRGRSTFVDMILRTAALDGDFLAIDEANLLHSDWPGGNAAYFYGGLFHVYLARRFGRAAVRELHQAFAGKSRTYPNGAVLPYAYKPFAEAILGRNLPELWEQWRREETARARAIRDRVVAAGVTESRRITFHGRNITGTRYLPGGEQIIYSRSSPVDGATVRRINRDGTNDQALVLETYSPRFAFSPGGDSIYYSQNAINERFDDFNDIYRFDVASEETTKITDAANPGSSLRARDPDVSPDGKQIVFVQNRLHQSWVTVGTFDGDAPESIHTRVLIPPYGDDQHASPRFAPGDTRIAVSSWLAGNRDIVIVDAESGALLRRVTFDVALDGNPAWSPDGRYLLYESDRSGISNIYAYDTRADRYWQVTHVVGGAFQPDVSPDGARLVFRNASGIGFDIHEMAFAPASWQAVRYDPQRGYTPEARGDAAPIDRSGWRPPYWGVARPRQSEPAIPLRESERDVPYAPEGLVPFNNNWVLLPAFSIKGDDPTFSATTFVRDSLGEHTAALSVGSSWYTGHVNWGVSYTNDTWYPTLRVGYADTADSFPAGDAGHVSQQVQSVTAGVELPILLRHLAAVRYLYQHFEGRDPLSTELLDLAGGERRARLEVGYVYGNTRSYPYSVGREDGGSIAVAGRWYSRALGGDFDELMLTIDGRAYINNPWFDNHVLALRLIGAFAFGPDFAAKFALGGPQSASFFTAQASQSYPLRGFDLDVERYPRGIGAVAVYAEYRFPLWQVERGLLTLPLFVEKVHGAVFADAGNTFGDGSERDIGQAFTAFGEGLRRLRLAAGVEARVDVTLAWAFPLQVRAGVAVPLLDGGRSPTPYRPIGRMLGFDIVYYLSFGAAI